MKKYIKIWILLLFFAGTSCDDYLDIVPDNIATIENAFAMRSTAERFLFTCFSYMPAHGHSDTNPGISSGDEIWYMFPAQDIINTDTWEIARGNQNKIDPYYNCWSGEKSGKNLWMGIRDCNIFLDNIDKVPNMDLAEKDRWRAEVKFLKAYYHFYLMRMYGPIPIIRTNIPIESETEDVKVFREPVDEAVDYIVELLDEALPALPYMIVDRFNEEGRITQPIAASLKAKVLVTAASALFNGNTEYKDYIDSRNVQLFNQTYDVKKWERAAKACEEAIAYCKEAGLDLYHFKDHMSNYVMVPQTQTRLDIRCAVTDKWNSEIIWGNSQSWAQVDFQRKCMPMLTNQIKHLGISPKGLVAPPIKMAELFYTKNGVPIKEDTEWDYLGRFDLRKAVAAEKYDIRSGYTTVELHFDREQRFYANLGFDGGCWFGNAVVANANVNSEDMFYVQAKWGQYAAQWMAGNYSETGYVVKKLVDFRGSVDATGRFTSNDYAWPEMRLADLYLLYAEALNEAYGPSDECYKYIDLVRKRAGLDGVVKSWNDHSVNKEKPATQKGLSEIIKQERMIELAFEGQRFWDLRRWKEAHIYLNNPIRGWSRYQSETAAYYQQVLLFNQSFQMKDYFWPIKETELYKNRNILQSPGW